MGRETVGGGERMEDEHNRFLRLGCAPAGHCDKTEHTHTFYGLVCHINVTQKLRITFESNWSDCTFH